MNEGEMRMARKAQLGITKQCYADCINSFSSNELSNAEKKCLQNCGNRQAQTMMVMAEVNQSMMAKHGGMGQF